MDNATAEELSHFMDMAKHNVYSHIYSPEYRRGAAHVLELFKLMFDSEYARQKDQEINESMRKHRQLKLAKVQGERRRAHAL